MNHEEVLVALPDYRAGRLQARERTAIEAHLRECPECAAAFEGVTRVARALREAGLHSAHPSSQEIVAYALGDSELNSTRRDAVRGHLDSCESCRQEVEATAKTEAILGAPEGVDPARWVRWPRAAWASLAAAAALVGALAYPAYVGLRALSEPSTGTARSPYFLEATTRGNPEGPIVEVLPDQRWVFLAIELPLGAPTRPAALELRLRRQDGPGADEIEVPASEVARAMGHTGILVVPVRAAALSPGEYELRLSERSEDGGAALLASYAFRLVRER